MTKTLALLLATTAITACATVPASGAFYSNGDDRDGATSYYERGASSGKVRFASDDDRYERGDDDDYRGRREDDDDDECDDDDDYNRNCGRAPAPAGSVAPPSNGLFGNGKPSVNVN